MLYLRAARKERILHNISVAIREELTKLKSCPDASLSCGSTSNMNTRFGKSYVRVEVILWHTERDRGVV